MLDNLLNLFNTNKKVLVIGEIILDKYIYGKTDRISSEVSIPVFKEESIEYRLGGAGNVASNLSYFGLDVSILSIVNLENWNIIKNLLSKNLINYNNIIFDNNYLNSVKSRYISNNYQCFRTDKENSFFKFNKNKKKELYDNIDNIIKNYECILLSDYNNGLLDDEITQYIINKANENNINILVDPKKGNYLKFKNSTLIKPNKNDAEFFCNFKIQSEYTILNACKLFVEKLNVKTCILTMSQNGMYIYNNGKLEHIKVRNNLQVIDVTGAGDTVLAALCLGLVNNKDLIYTCKMANIFVENVISRFGTSRINLIDIIKENNKIIKSYEQLTILSDYIKKEKKKLVFTTGCFDIIHKGHIDSVKKSKELGKILFVALNSDKSIINLKGNKRPIQNLKSRLEIISSIQYIDFLMVFDENVPNKIYDILNPDIFTKGNDYDLDKIKKLFPNIKNFVPLNLVSNYSTTNVIKKIINFN